jgi:hypothetical protein
MVEELDVKDLEKIQEIGCFNSKAVSGSRFAACMPLHFDSRRKSRK